MHNIRGMKLLRIVLHCLASSLALLSVQAQTNPAPDNSNGAGTPANSKKQSDPKLTPPQGKMRGLTNEMRKAAAIRNRDRANHPTPNGTPQRNQNGGKQ